jgi:hypothetical protein
MEGLVKKYQQRFRKVRGLMEEWEQLQSRLISQFSNASAIIERLKVIVVVVVMIISLLIIVKIRLQF